MRLRPVPVLVCATLALSVAVAGGTASDAAPARSHAAPRPDPAGPSWYRTHGTHPARAATATTARSATPAARTNPRLDPGAVNQPATPAGTVDVAVRGRARAVAAQARTLGGRVVNSAHGTSVVALARKHVAELAQRAGITDVGTVNRPYPLDTTPGPSQAVPASGAGSADGSGTGWHPQDPDTGTYSGVTGAGVELAIVDLGYGDDAQNAGTEMAAGHLGPQTQVINEGCADGATAYDGDSHGLAVAEVAQQQAPDTQLYLYCVDSPTGLANAVTDIVAKHIPIASSSIGWLQDARGDATAPAGSVAYSVRYARQHGVLWVNAAGNEVPEHYSGTLADTNKDRVLDMGNASASTYPYESNFYYTAPGSAAAPTSLAFVLQWDEWPVATHQVTLQAFGVQCHTDLGAGTGDGMTNGQLDSCNGTWLDEVTATSVHNGQPTLGLETPTSEVGFTQIWQVRVALVGGSFLAGRRYDLFGEGDTYYASDLSCPTTDDDGNCIYAAAAKNGSVLSPANSPYALAVGAVDAGIDNDGDADPTGMFERFSSQGPTIDQRVKPDIAGWDGLSSYVNGFNDCSEGSVECGFYGTSAAAPSVAGAAALVKAANPDMDAAQLQYFLEQRAGHGKPANPPNDQTGHGILTLGAPPADPPPAGFGVPAAGRYVGLATPQRILDTRHGSDGRAHPLGEGKTASVVVNVPAGATAVAINLSGTNATGSAYLSVYPGTIYTGTANVNVSTAEPASAAFTVVTLPADGSRRITVRNGRASVNAVIDLVGYFTTSGGAGYTPLTTAKRVFDATVGLNHYVTVHPGISTAAHPTAAVVDLAVLSPRGSGWFTAAPSCSTPTSSLSYQHYSRNDLAFVRLSSAGTFCLGVHGAAAAKAVVDVVGSFGDGGAGYVGLPTGQRVMDTRYSKGNNGSARTTSPIGPASSGVYYGANIGDVPAAGEGLLASVTELNTTGNGYLQLFPGSTRPSVATSNISFTKGRIVPNGAIVPLSTGHQYGVYNSAGTTNVVIDMFGYFV